jgi:hypothetical protein
MGLTFEHDQLRQSYVDIRQRLTEDYCALVDREYIYNAIGDCLASEIVARRDPGTGVSATLRMTCRDCNAPLDPTGGRHRCQAHTVAVFQDNGTRLW